MRNVLNTTPAQVGRVKSLFVNGEQVKSLEVDLQGINGSKKYRGWEREVGVHDDYLLRRGFVRGQMIPNDRMWSATSTEDLFAISERLGVGEIYHSALLANVVFEGLGHLIRHGAGTMFIFDYKVVFEVSRVNTPCAGVGKRVDAQFPGQGVLQQFPKAAAQHRGLLGRVVAPGTIKQDARVEMFEQVRV